MQELSQEAPVQITCHFVCKHHFIFYVGTFFHDLKVERVESLFITFQTNCWILLFFRHVLINNSYFD